MGNRITNKKVNADSLKMSNGGTSVLMSVLALSACDTAVSGWEKRFAQWIVEKDQDYRGLGAVGFDISNIGWRSDGFDQQKQFVLNVIDIAMNRHRWDALYYDPPFVKQNLKQFRDMIEAFHQEHIDPGHVWPLDDEGMAIALCYKHHVYLHVAGCILCNDEPRESDSPTPSSHAGDSH